MYNDNCSVSNYYNGKYFLCKTDTQSHNHSSLGTENKNVLDINSSSHNIKPSQNKSYPSVILPNNRHQIFNTTQGHYDAVSFIYIPTEGGYMSASGVVVGENEILTNKHVVNGAKGNPRNISVHPSAKMKMIILMANLWVKKSYRILVIVI